MRQKALKKKEEKERLTYQEMIKKLNEVHLQISRRSSDKDIIFGSVSAGDIQVELARLGFDLDKKKIMLDVPVKRLGSFTVPVKVYHDERAEIKVTVSKEETSAPGSAADGQKNS